MVFTNQMVIALCLAIGHLRAVVQFAGGVTETILDSEVVVADDLTSMVYRGIGEIKRISHILLKTILFIEVRATKSMIYIALAETYCGVINVSTVWSIVSAIKIIWMRSHG